MAENLQNQVALVTGAGRGIGRAIALELGGLGLRVALAARTGSELEETARQIRTAAAIPVDLRRTDSIRRLVERTERELGPIDVLVNAAGVYHYGPVMVAAEADFDSVVETNLKGLFSACRFVLPGMVQRGRGHIINIASIAGRVGTAGRAIYCASKFGVVGFSQALAEEVREQGVRVSVICPGSTNTTFSTRELEGRDPARMLQPEDVARVVRMLLEQADHSFVSEVVMRPARKP